MTVQQLVTTLLKAVFDGHLNKDSAVLTADGNEAVFVVQNGEVFVTDTPDDLEE